MSNTPSRKATGRIQPGEVRNPHGKNQYLYRREFEQTIGRLLAGELSAEEAQTVPDWAVALLRPGMSRGEALARITVGGARLGYEKYTAEVLKRVWPVTSKYELTGANGDALPAIPAPPDLSMLSEEDRAHLRRIARQLI